MDSEKYLLAKELKEKIESVKYRIHQIEVLLPCCGLSCEIDGTPPNKFRRTNKYTSPNKEFIKKLLESDLEKLSSELISLTNQFDKI